MISVRNPWKNSWTIRLVAAIDIVFAFLLVSIYMQKLLAPISNENVHSEVQRAPSLKLFLLGPIIFNSFQVVMSFNLFSAARRGSEPVIAYAKGTTWFQFSTVMLAFLVLKLFLILWFPPHGSISRREIVGTILIVLEAIFKIFGLFIVKEFIDDLKSILSLFPTPQFYCIYASQPPVIFPTTTNTHGCSNTNTNINGNTNPTTYTTCPSLPQASTAPLPPPSLPQQNRNSTIIAVI